MTQMSDPARHTGPALEAHQRFLLWLIPTLEKFPTPSASSSVTASNRLPWMCWSV